VVVSLGAGGVGLTLTAASHMLIVELPWRPMDLTQAYGRAHGRVSDPHGLTAYHMLAAGTLDDAVERILNRKLAQTAAVQDGEIVAQGGGESIVGELLDSVLR
jgi:SWI/SNF-related matrix-associated actin-dependent regulator 1 of chromatin subfamily A